MPLAQPSRLAPTGGPLAAAKLLLALAAAMVLTLPTAWAQQPILGTTEPQTRDAAWHLEQAERYEMGLDGAPVNLDSSAWHLTQAAHLNAPEALYLLGVRQARGINMARQVQPGLNLVERAANRGFLPALVWLMEAYGDTAHRFFEVPGQSVPHRPDLAVRYARQAAQAGHAPAYRYLGWACLNAYGLPRNDSLAVHYLHTAADSLDHLPAMLDLGQLYLKGRLPQGLNTDLARRYFHEVQANAGPDYERAAAAKVGLHQAEQLPRLLHNAYQLLNPFAAEGAFLLTAKP